MVGLFSALVLLCTNIFNISTSDFNANLTAMENVLKVLSYHGQIDAQISTNSCQIGPNDPQEHKEKLQAPCYYNFPERKWSPGMRWDNFSSHTITLFGNDAFIQLSKLAKSGWWHCHLQWQCTRSCVTYLMQEMFQWKEDELLFTYMPACKFSNQLTLEQWAFEYGLPFFWYALYITSEILNAMYNIQTGVQKAHSTLKM